MTIKQVQQFHNKFDLPNGSEDVMDTEALNFRIKFLQEELDEFSLAMNGNVDRVKAFDALLDLAYVTFGTALFMGITPAQWVLGMDAVQKANMTKQRATSAHDSKRGTKLDVVKPPGWKGPEHELQTILALPYTLDVNPHRLTNIATKDLLQEISQRGGHPAALADACLLCIDKSQDYNQGQLDPHNVDRTEYFPFGALSYAQMLHTKSKRFNSLVVVEQKGGVPNFEGLKDTALDIINYAGFYIASTQDGE